MRILLVDDDADLLDVTAYALRREGFEVLTAPDGMVALARLERERPDLLVLDAGLPRLGGLEVLRRLRRADETPVIVLSGRHEEEAVVAAFRAGADDYVAKPFSPRQLAMRIRAVGRRAGLREAPAPGLRVGDLELEVESHEVRRGGRAVHLTLTEFRLLHLLASNPGRVVATGRLIEYAWGYDGEADAPLKSHISHLRAKLGLGARGPAGAIEAVHRVGYRLVPAVA